MIKAVRLDCYHVEINMSVAGDEIFVIRMEDAIALRDSLNVAVSQNVPPGLRKEATPEVLGMGSTPNPLAFAELTGQEIPPADELKMLAGQRNVGGKHENKPTKKRRK